MLIERCCELLRVERLLLDRSHCNHEGLVAASPQVRSETVLQLFPGRAVEARGVGEDLSNDSAPGLVVLCQLDLDDDRSA